MTNVLVTAVGSELAFSVLKALKLSDLPLTITGCDIYPEVVGKYWCEQFYQVPPAVEIDRYISQIKLTILSEKIEVIIPTNDHEITLLANYQEEFLNLFNCRILTNKPKELLRFNDKWFAFEWFKEHNIPTAASYLVSQILADGKASPELVYPLIIKPRIGGGSRFIFKVRSFEELRHFAGVVPDGILQEYLSPDDEEYTAGTYRTLNNEVFVIILKRTLKFGMTNTAQVISDGNLEKFVHDVIRKTNLTGVNNVQFRITREGPKVLEINPRFSGTTGIRAKFGFNEVEMSIRELILAESVCRPLLKQGFVLRFLEEQYHFDK